LLSAISLNQTLFMVMALCRLHNFCVDERLKEKAPSARHSHDLADPIASNKVEIVTNGGIQLWRREGEDHAVPHSLLHGGEHHDDILPKDLRRVKRQAKQACRRDGLPRDYVLERVVKKGVHHPEPNQWRNHERNNNNGEIPI
jgi:hypothetical protein